MGIDRFSRSHRLTRLFLALTKQTAYWLDSSIKLLLLENTLICRQADSETGNFRLLPWDACFFQFFQQSDRNFFQMGLKIRRNFWLKVIQHDDGDFDAR